MTYPPKKAAIKITSNSSLHGNWIISTPGTSCQNGKEYLVIKKKLMANITSIKSISNSLVFLANLRYKTENTIDKTTIPICGENDSSPLGLGRWHRDGIIT